MEWNWKDLRQPNVQNSKSRYLVSYSFSTTEFIFCLFEDARIFSLLQFIIVTPELIFCLFEDARMRVMEDRGRGDLLHYY